ncbi:MAG: glycoside hydrolase family 32 protein [bacterium]|nr:glycoside hydrolase family 32 protein [bacterium]
MKRRDLIKSAILGGGALAVACGEGTRDAQGVPSSASPVIPQRDDWPRWHLTALPDEGVWRPGDANGCIWWKGRYHLMYIYQDPRFSVRESDKRGGHCWGHASSPDLVHWTYHPAALVPRPGDPDKGIFSGNAFLDKDGAPMLCWFGIDAGVCIATAENDELLRWKKHPANPIIPVRETGDIRVWDPYLWLEGDTYVCLLGGNKLPNGKDTLYACTSNDLVSWEMRHSFYEHASPDWTSVDEDCSCPDFFRLGDRHVLMSISHKVGARCYVGRFDRAQVKFFPERHIRMNWPGGNFFAPESLQGPDGRRIFWAWVTDPRSMEAELATGSGFQSMPRVLALSPDGGLRITPAAELEQLRRNHRNIAPRDLAADSEANLSEAAGDCSELGFVIDPGETSRVGLKVRCSADGEEETALWYEPAAKQLVLDMSRSTLRKDVTYTAGPLQRASNGEDAVRSRVEAPFELLPGEPLRLRVFMDKPLLEVFANDRQCVTQVIYPRDHRAAGVKLLSEGAAARLVSGEAWDMAAARFTDGRG